jgi:hypothetical protein
MRASKEQRIRGLLRHPATTTFGGAGRMSLFGGLVLHLECFFSKRSAMSLKCLSNRGDGMRHRETVVDSRTCVLTRNYFHGMEEVRGSNPLFSTTPFEPKADTFFGHPAPPATTLCAPRPLRELLPPDKRKSASKWPRVSVVRDLHVAAFGARPKSRACDSYGGRRGCHAHLTERLRETSAAAKESKGVPAADTSDRYLG